MNLANSDIKKCFWSTTDWELVKIWVNMEKVFFGLGKTR
jgi:hypothetical protein